ncbi:hypothetical protein EON66_11400 [archaeon]|nr:MAG: hypothetical protein EON66_11400 [archaeon]
MQLNVDDLSQWSFNGGHTSSSSSQLRSSAGDARSQQRSMQEAGGTSASQAQTQLPTPPCAHGSMSLSLSTHGKASRTPASQSPRTASQPLAGTSAPRGSPDIRTAPTVTLDA